MPTYKITQTYIAEDIWDNFEADSEEHAKELIYNGCCVPDETRAEDTMGFEFEEIK
tara:strand:- start:41 stop:208 length:168 start_codon:yes stop_codon:yes gene_type:complete